MKSLEEYLTEASINKVNIKCEPNEIELFMSLLLSYYKNNKDWDEKTLQKNDIENLFTNIYDASKMAKCEFIDDHRWKRNIKENIKN